MENPIFKAYQKVDDTIMYGVNKGVRAWNWTTGKRKCDLANHFLSIGLISYSTGVFSVQEPILTTLIPPMIIMTHSNQKSNESFQEKEDSLAQKGLKLSPSATRKYEVGGVMGGVLGLAFGGLGYNLDDGSFPLTTYLVSLSNFSFALSDYVMRAENLPPRKSVFERAKEKLSEFVERYKPSPLPQPAFVSVPIRKNLEDRVF